jgi:hypothetical protein
LKQELQSLGDEGRGRQSTGKTGARAREEARAKELAALLRPGQSIALLQQLHILTREGQLNQDSRRKLKQVYHLYQFMETLLHELEQAPAADALAPESLIWALFCLTYFSSRGHKAWSMALKAAPIWWANPATWLSN